MNKKHIFIFAIILIGIIMIPFISKASLQNNIQTLRTTANVGSFGEILTTIFDTNGTKIKKEYLDLPVLWEINGGQTEIYFNGNVGIGVANPTDKLAVNGTVIANAPLVNAHAATKNYFDAKLPPECYGEGFYLQYNNGVWNCLSTLNFAWEVGTWSACDNGCGTGQQTRTVVCKDINTNLTVLDSECSTSKPDTTQPCSSYSTCTFSWQYAGWGSCSNTCGGGTQTRVATCTRSDGTVSPGQCSGSPVTSQACTGSSGCTYTYSWQYTGWGSCSASCGGGTRYRSATCIRSDGASASSGLCSGSPYTAQGCSSTSGCTYSWQYGGWGSCSNSCGGGSQTRSATCKRSDGATVSSGYCGSASTSQSCSSYSSCSYSWQYGGWGGCSATCGGGTQTRSATCKRSDGATVSGGNCGSSSTSQSCNTQLCYSCTSPNGNNGNTNTIGNFSCPSGKSLCEPGETNYICSGNSWQLQNTVAPICVSGGLFNCP